PAPQRPVQKPAPKLPANVYARVGGRDITTQEIMAYLAALGGYPLVQNRVQVVIAEQEAKRLGVRVTDAEVNQAVANQKKAIIAGSATQTGIPMTFEEIGARQGISSGLLRERTRYELLIRKTYARSIGDLKGKIKVSHVLIASRPLQPAPTEAPKPQTPEDANKLDAEALVKVKKVQADLKAGTIKFADAVKQSSDDPSKVQNNGDLGWIAPDTQFVPEFKEAAFKLQKVGDVTEPVKTQFGYHLIRLDARGDATTPAELAAYRRQIETGVDGQTLQQWFAGVTQKATITYNPLAKANVGPAAVPKKPVVTSKRSGL
ncbi:MAG: peptidylprolyl isomerase, partial [Cytophagales bacterium]|nr:peptidylprolyl isomerase [Armatimonadota bacterium]